MAEYLIAFFVSLQVLDIATTMAFLSRGIQEGNSFVKKLMDAMGVIPALILIKTVLVVAVLLVYTAFQAYFMEYLWMLNGVLAAACVGYCYVVKHNYERYKGRG